MDLSYIDKELEKLFPSINWSDEEIANYAFHNKRINENNDSKDDIVINVETELSVDEYMKENKNIELRKFIEMAKNKL